MTKERHSAYTVRCIEGGDVGICATEFIDRFQILGDNVPLFTISFDYQSDGQEGDVDAKVRCLTEFKPVDLPFIADGIHLIGVLHEFLMDAVSEDALEFFAEAFVNEEGDSIDLPIEFGYETE